MNVLTTIDLSTDGAPLLRTGVDNDEEFLIASFTDVQMYALLSTISHNNNNEEEEEATMLLHSGSTGVLYVTTSRVIWLSTLSEQQQPLGYAWKMNYVTLHAISRDPCAFPRPCLYCQISNQDVSEVRFVPMDDKTLQAVFDAFCKSAEMNPDDDSDDGNDDDEGWICDEDEVADGARAAYLAAHFDSMLQVSPEFDNPIAESGQFDDADEDSLL